MILSLLAAGAVLLVIPSWAGLALAAALVTLLPRVIRALPTARTHHRAAQRSESALLLAEALAAHLVAGVALVESLDSCADVDAGDLGAATRQCAQLIRMGSADPFTPWRHWDELAPLARELTRALHQGNPVAAATERGAQRIRAKAHREHRMAVERISVRITAPVALCLLPAFLLLAVVPSAMGILQQVQVTAIPSSSTTP